MRREIAGRAPHRTFCSGINDRTGDAAPHTRDIFADRSVFVTKSDREAHVFYRLHARGMHDKKTIIAHRRNHLRFRKARCGPCAGCQRYSACIYSPSRQFHCSGSALYIIYYIDEKSEGKKKEGKKAKETLLRYKVAIKGLGSNIPPSKARKANAKYDRSRIQSYFFPCTDCQYTLINR